MWWATALMRSASMMDSRFCKSADYTRRKTPASSLAAGPPQGKAARAARRKLRHGKNHRAP
jgi:hypothetical protein